MNKIKQMTCNCGCEKVAFQVSGGDDDNAWGAVSIDKDGKVTHSYTDEIKTLKDVEEAAKKGIIDELVFTCMDCEDETAGHIIFEDNEVYTDEWEAFEKAFPQIPVEKE